MSRLNAIILGIGLAVLWAVGLAAGATSWLTWLDGVAALLTFGIAAFVPSDMDETRAMLPPIAMALGLFALWIVGLAMGATTWLTWLTFVAGCAFVLDAVAVVGQQRTPTLREA